MKKKKYLILSFIIPAIVYLFFFYINGVLSDKMILSGDSLVQYHPLFGYLKNVLNGDNSIFYSFSKSIGGTMFGTFFYYLSSPLNLLIMLFNKLSVLDFITYLTILKLSLCGFTMYIYMSRKYKSDSLLILIFSLCYSFMGYNLNYFLNIMWLDIVFMAPLVMIGIDKITEQKSPLFYIITLTISIFSNYYIAYMLCIFNVLYFIYELLLKFNIKKDKKIIINISKKFIISSLLSGLMCSFFLIPSVLESINYNRISKKVFSFNFNIFNLFSKTYMGTGDILHPFNNYTINLYCGIIILPLVYLYFKNKTINKKDKYLALAIILFMILPCFCDALNIFWHVFSKPYGYAFRYSFLLCFFLLNIAYKSITNLSFKTTDILEYLSIYISYSVIIIFIMYFKNYYEFLSHQLIWLTICFLILYAYILLRFKNSKKLFLIIFVITLTECILNVYLSTNYAFYGRDEIKNQKDQLDIIENFKNSGRIMNASTNSLNLSIQGNYNDTSVFLSTINNGLLNTLTKLGQNYTPLDGQNSYINNPKLSYIANSMLNFETIIYGKNDLPYDLIDTSYANNLYIFKNKYTLGLGYIIKDQCNNLNNEFPYSENAFNCITGSDKKYFKEIKPSFKENDLNVYEIDSDFYIYLPNITDNAKYYKSIFKENLIHIYTDYAYVVNNDKKQIKIKSNDNLKIYYFDFNEFINEFNKIEKEDFNYTIDNNTLTGSINTKGGLFMLTIPYEKGIKILVDGKQIEYVNVLDNLIGFNLDKGFHQIEVTYKQPGIGISIFVSIISLSICILYCVMENKKTS